MNADAGEIEFVDDGHPAIYTLPPDVPPSWWPQLQEIAARLGVEPTHEHRDAVLTFAYKDEHYDGAPARVARSSRRCCVNADAIPDEEYDPWDAFAFVARVADLDPSLGPMDIVQLVDDARRIYWRAVKQLADTIPDGDVTEAIARITGRRGTVAR